MDLRDVPSAYSMYTLLKDISLEIDKILLSLITLIFIILYFVEYMIGKRVYKDT